MDGKAIAAAALGDAGLGTLATCFPGARPTGVPREAPLPVPPEPHAVRAARP